MSTNSTSGQSETESPSSKNLRGHVEYVLRILVSKGYIVSFNPNPKLAMPLAMAPAEHIFDIKIANRKHVDLVILNSKEALSAFMRYCKEIGKFVIPCVIDGRIQRHNLVSLITGLLMGKTRSARLRLQRLRREGRRRSRDRRTRFQRFHMSTPQFALH